MQTKPSASRYSDGRSADIADPEQLEILAHPTRFAIVSAVAWGELRTIRDVGERIGRKPSALYRHFDVLVEYGILEVIGSVPTARRAAKTYFAPRNLRLVYQPEEPDAVDALNRMIEYGARRAARGFAAATSDGRAVTRGVQRDTMYASSTGWLTRAERKTFNRMLDDLHAFLRDRPQRPNTQLIETAIVMFPPAVPDDA